MSVVILFLLVYFMFDICFYPPNIHRQEERTDPPDHPANQTHGHMEMCPHAAAAGHLGAQGAATLPKREAEATTSLTQMCREQMPKIKTRLGPMLFKKQGGAHFSISYSFQKPQLFLPPPFSSRFLIKEKKLRELQTP